MIKRFVAIVMLIGLVGSNVNAQPVRNIDAMRPIPGTNMQMVETEGRAFFMSQNGRYVIKGQLLDMWNGSEIKSVRDLEETGERVSFKDMGLNLDDLMSLKYGNGSKEVAAFVAPGCPHCETVMSQMIGLENEYTFRLIPLPFFGEQSKNHVMQLACNSESHSEEAAKALILENYTTLPVKNTDCDMEKLQRSVLTAQIMGIQSVPYLVAHDGRVQVGAPAQGLANFLRGGK